MKTLKYNAPWHDAVEEPNDGSFKFVAYECDGKIYYGYGYSTYDGTGWSIVPTQTNSVVLAWMEIPKLTDDE